jgi:hypothetical protein
MLKTKKNVLFFLLGKPETREHDPFGISKNSAIFFFSHGESQARRGRRIESERERERERERES